MTKKKGIKGLTHEQRLIKALNELPNPIIDNKHRIKIYVEDNRARSNESRFEHIIQERHELTPLDIKKIASKINTSELKIDNERTKTYSLYIKRNTFTNDYIKVSLNLDFRKSNEATIKTIFIRKNYK